MDSEDRDHFKTIAGAQDGLPLASPKPQTAGNSTSLPSPAYCLSRAEMMFGCYRKDEAQNPETYCAAISATLGLYPKAVVDFVTDPRTGIPSESKWLPNVAEVRVFCNSAAARMKALAEPTVKKSTRRYDPLPPAKWWDLFVPNTVTGYDKMLARAETAKPEYYKYDRGGIWVPHIWWEERHGKIVKPEAELKPLVVSEELARQLNPAAFVKSDDRGGF